MLTPNDYSILFKSSVLTTDAKKLKELDFICSHILSNENIYRLVEKGTDDYFGVPVPWPIIAAIHYRESNQDFHCHLHNGDPLTGRTIRVPIGRPLHGEPPFSWTESAVDAFDGAWMPYAWDVPGTLEFIERYNGRGYQKHGVNSPYLWDYTDKYTSGLYRADGVFDPAKKESRPGAVSILKTLALKGVTLAFTGLDSSGEVLH